MKSEKILKDNNQEEIIWTGKSSQWINLRTYIYSFLMILVVLITAYASNKAWICFFLIYPFIRILYACCYTYFSDYKLTSQRLIYRYGIINRLTCEIELYSVKDVYLSEPWYLRILKLGNIELVSSTHPLDNFLIQLIKNAEEVRELIRTAKQQIQNKSI